MFWRFKNQQAIRKGPWKLLVDGEEQYLYNLDTDPEEMHDVGEMHPDLVDSLSNLLMDWTMEMEQYLPRTK